MIVVEDHQKIGGLFQLLAGEIMAQQSSGKVVSLGVDAEFGQSAYNAIDLYSQHHMDAKSIVQHAVKIADH